MNTRKSKKIGLPSAEGSRSRKTSRQLISNVFKPFLPETNASEHQDVGEPCENKQTDQSKKKRAISDLMSKRKSDDFETPDKNIKKAPKTKAKPRPKKQQNIKTAFLKNEELFSSVTAQHCIAESFSPNEMQMALALSMSETDRVIIDVDNLDEHKEDRSNIRAKLKKFGFRVADPEEYALTAFLPTNKKTKWANKFTPLTLRDPNRQLQRVNRKVEEFLSSQFIMNESTDAEEQETRQLNSEILIKFVARKNILTAPELIEQMGLVEFYVLSLFEPSTTKAGHLLKDVHCIAGRERTPRKTKTTRNVHVEDFCDPALKSPAAKKSRNEEISTYTDLDISCSEVALHSEKAVEKLPINGSLSPCSDPDLVYHQTMIAETVKQSLTGVHGNTCSSLSARIDHLNCNGLNETYCKSLNSDTKISNLPEKNVTGQFLHIQRETEVQNRAQLLSARAGSPDIFADSDVDLETDEINGVTDVRKSSSEHDITTFELFSSDEVKMSSENKYNSNDMNHNLTPIIDLTQCDSDPNSQQSTPPSMSIQTFEHKRCTFSPTLLASNAKSEHTKSPFFKRSSDIDDLFSSNECYFIEKSVETKPSSSSFESSVLDDLIKSRSLNKTNSTQTEDSINFGECDDSATECIILSDDEVNYSIWKADKTNTAKEQKDTSVENVTIDRLLNDLCMNKSEQKHEFSFADLVAASQPICSIPDEFGFDLETKSNTSVEMDTSNRSEFGILEEQSPFKTPIKTPKKTPKNTPSSVKTKCRRALSTSFLDTTAAESSAPLKRFSSMKKFTDFTKSDSESSTDLDDIDKLIYGSPSKKHYRKPSGLDQLLTATISADIESPKKTTAEQPQEFEFNGRIYLVRTTHVEQTPNFKEMDTSALENHLLKYGLKKSLTRKQAIKVLEYIFNHTHPCLVDDADIPSQTIANDMERNTMITREVNDERLNVITETESKSTFNLKDCWGDVLLMNTESSLEIKDEQYIVQTNINKKTATALLPFHIAWYNLVKSNTKLHEAILHYEPIDLQEIYLFFKGIGYRYDPKELKYFFDSRSIIFRYDLNKSDPSAGANRHVRKNRNHLTQRSKNNKKS